MRDSESGDDFHRRLEIGAHEEQSQQKQNVVVARPNVLDTELEKARESADVRLSFGGPRPDMAGDLKHIARGSEHFVSQYPAINVVNGGEMCVVRWQVPKQGGAQAQAGWPFCGITQHYTNVILVIEFEAGR